MFTKKYKLLDDPDGNSIEVSRDIEYNCYNEIQTKIVISKLLGDTNEIISTEELVCQNLDDLCIVAKYLISLKAGSNTLRCCTWLKNKLHLKY